MPGHPISIQGSLLEVDDVGPFDLEFSLRSTGNVYFDGEENPFDCPLAGPVFNPLAEQIYGVPNQYADPSRGTIDPVTVVPAEADESGIFNWSQDSFLQNLSGKDSIMSKAIRI